MRFIILGAGAVGGLMAARLFQSGQEVVAIARGAHLDAWRAKGLRLVTPDEDVVLGVPVAAHPREVGLTADDVIILAAKSQDTVAALDDIEALCPDAAIVCAQNGVANEREALRRFERVYGMCVLMLASYVDPGVVQCNSAPMSGILDLGRYPGVADELAVTIAERLSAAQFSSRAEPSIMRQKHGKLLLNLANAVEAVCGTEGAGDLVTHLRGEGRAVFEAAGISYFTQDEDRARRGDLLKMRSIAGLRRGGGSSWQSLARGTGTIEADHLNGEIVLLGRLHGVPTPANALMLRLAKAAAREGRGPGAMTVAEVEAILAAC